MTIAAVGGQAGGATGSGASISRAFPSNVSAGSLVVIVGWRYDPASNAYLAADCSKTAGTATIGTISLDASFNLNDLDGSWGQVGIWTCLVTGAGSLTLQIAGGDATGAPSIATHEFTGNWDSTRFGPSSSNSTATNDTTNANSGNATSTGAALFIGGLSVANTGNTVTVTPDAAFTTIYEFEAGATSQPGSGIYQIVSGATTDRAEWTIGTPNTGWCSVVAIYKEIASTTAGLDDSGIWPGFEAQSSPTVISVW